MAKQKQSDDDPIIIKKYANRRLYDTARSCYVTLEDLAQMVRDGQDFVVQDAKSHDDITRSVLAQIIFDEEAKGQNMLPTNFLRQLIRLYGDTLQGFVPSYLEASMDTFTSNQEKMREQVASAFSANPALGNFETMARTNMEWFENAMSMFSPFGVSEKAKAAAAPEAPTSEDAQAPSEKPGSPNKSEIKAMKEQLEAMQAQLSKLTGSD